MSHLGNYVKMVQYLFTVFGNNTSNKGLNC